MQTAPAQMTADEIRQEIEHLRWCDMRSPLTARQLCRNDALYDEQKRRDRAFRAAA